MRAAVIVCALGTAAGAQTIPSGPTGPGAPTAPAPIERATMTPTPAAMTAWTTDFRARARARGIADATVEAALRGATFLPDVLERDANQAEFSKTLWDYLATAVSDLRIENGRARLVEHADLLDAIEAEYGVDRHVVTAIWGLESAYGTFRGDTPVISSLSTLASGGRRAAFFEEQLVAALRILEDGDTSPEDMVGSWAGAMGHTQFIPTSYLDLAVDFDGDGRRDIWGDDPADALASTAAYLADAGWITGTPWGVEVTLPDGFDYLMADRRDIRTPAEWADLGVTATDGTRVPNDLGAGSILLPGGHGGAAFVIFANFAAIERYNTADSYVIAVGHLADRLRGGDPILADWPDDRALTGPERRELQQLLTDAGHSTQGVDGRIGPNTIDAIRDYQQAQGLVPDGYAAPALLTRLRG